MARSPDPPAATLVAVLAAVQWAAHHWFALVTASCTGTVVPVSGHGGAHGGTPVAASCGAHAMATTSVGAGFGMLTAHTAAVVVLALLLARGERALLRLIAWLAPILRLPLAGATVVVPAGRRPLAPAVVDATGTLDAVRSVLSRRGPPWPVPPRTALRAPQASLVGIS